MIGGLLKAVTIETFQGEDKIRTRFVSSHDAIEMESSGKVQNLQTFLGALTGMQHSSFYEALQAEKLSKIEILLDKSQGDIAQAIRMNAKTMGDLADFFERNSKKDESPEPLTPKEDKKRERPGVT